MTTFKREKLPYNPARGLVDSMCFVVDECYAYVHNRMGWEILEGKRPKDVSHDEWHAAVAERFERVDLPVMDKHYSESLTKLEQEIAENPKISPERRENFLRDVGNLMMDVRQFGIRYMKGGKKTHDEYAELKLRQKFLTTTMKSLSRKENFFELLAERLRQQIPGRGDIESEGLQEQDGQGKKKKRGRLNVTVAEAQKRRQLKAEWERGSEAKVSKADFCEDKDIKVEYLNDSVLRWCRDHPE